MPTKRTPRTRLRQGQIHPAVVSWLKDETPSDDSESRLAILQCQWFSHLGFFEAWKVCRDEILAEWSVEYPGTRPSMWWIVDAPRDIREGGPYFYRGPMPLLRQRLSGTGSLWCDHSAYVPEHHYGIPTRWITKKDLEGRHGQKLSGNPFAYDPCDPPVFEAQAAYLKRHQLFLPGEAKRLAADDFAPEHVELGGGCDE